MSGLTKFDYLLNAFEAASQHVDPASQGYAEKRVALYAYVRGLELDSILLDAAQDFYTGVDFAYPQSEGMSCLILALPDGTRVGADLRQALRAGLPSSDGERE